MMCPQLFINYKLKSVAHLPWRQMTYKFLNTIIDDLFAFVIKMPMLHRLSVFRDGGSKFHFAFWFSQEPSVLMIVIHCDKLKSCLSSAIRWSLFSFSYISFLFGLHADIIFLIYLYQRWIYPVDRKRVNEFGFGGEEDDQSLIASSSDADAAQNGEESTEGDKKTNWAGEVL